MLLPGFFVCLAGIKKLDDGPQVSIVDGDQVAGPMKRSTSLAGLPAGLCQRQGTA